MSHDSSSHASGGFHPHILPLKMYISVGLALFVLTGVTVWVATLDVGPVTALVLALGVATVKASLVALFFMHLLYDNKIYATAFVGSLLFLSVFIVASVADMKRRGDLDPIRSEFREHPPIEGIAKAQQRQAAAGAAAHGAADSTAPAASETAAATSTDSASAQSPSVASDAGTAGAADSQTNTTDGSTAPASN